MSSSTVDPETLARIAAQLNPQLACDDPAKAIQLARNLLIAADPELLEEEALRAEEISLQEESERHDELFPLRECISIAEAFGASPGHYKSETRFAAALRKENLTTKALPEKKEIQHEVTSLRAVDELFWRQNKAKKARDRARKTPRQRKTFDKVSRKSQSKKQNAKSKKRNAIAKRRPRTGK